MSVNQLVTVTEAARLVGRSRQSLYRDYIKTGKLSPSQDLVTNRKLVSISELIRVFGDLKLTELTDKTVNVTTPMRQELTDELTTTLQAKVALLEADNASLRDRLRDKDEHISDLRSTVRLLEYKAPNEQPKRLWWWPFGR
jgi:hypothetical protein